MPLTIDRKNSLTRNAEPQFTAVATATARPRTRPGKISLITVHTTGPSENANEMMNTTSAISVTIPAVVGPVPALAVPDALEREADGEAGSRPCRPGPRGEAAGGRACR